MIWTVSEIADAVWAYPSRTVDGQAPAASNGSPLDNIAFAVWTYGTRTASGGVATFSIQVAQTMPAPVQAGTLQTVIPVTVAQVAPVPVQVITAEAPVTFEISVAQVAPAPAQTATAETPSAKKQQGGGGFSYYPPIYAIRTNGHQEAPAPGQRASAQYKPARVVQESEPIKATYSLGGVEYTLVPAQSAVLKSHRAVKNRDREDREILTLLASL